MPSNVLVSGAGSSGVNGTYTYRGEENGKPYYNLVGASSSIDSSSISWDGLNNWVIFNAESNVPYEANENVEFPWLVATWLVNDEEPAPIVTEVPVLSQPTFGLPTDVVALITSRFGTVANYLRLRNLGQI